MSAARDLSLILLGVALARSERSRVMVLTDNETVPEDVRAVLVAIRDKDVASLRRFMSQLGITIASGQDVIQAMIDKFVDDAKLQAARETVSLVRMAATQSDVDVLRSVLKDCLSKMGE